MYTIVLSANNTFSSSFLICIPLISFCYFITLDRTWNTILNRVWESRHSCLFPNFGGIASIISQFNLVFAVSFLYIVFIMFKYRPWIPDHSNTFNMNWYCILPHKFEYTVLSFPLNSRKPLFTYFYLFVYFSFFPDQVITE